MNRSEALVKRSWAGPGLALYTQGLFFMLQLPLRATIYEAWFSFCQDRSGFLILSPFYDLGRSGYVWGLGLSEKAGSFYRDDEAFLACSLPLLVPAGCAFLLR